MEGGPNGQWGGQRPQVQLGRAQRDATSHLQASGVLPPVSGLGLELSHSAISRLCSTEHRQTQDGMVDGNRETGQSEDREGRCQRTP